MELFSVQRYVGDKHEKISEHSTQDEDVLQKLLRKVEKRKKKLLKEKKAKADEDEIGQQAETQVPDKEEEVNGIENHVDNDVEAIDDLATVPPEDVDPLDAGVIDGFEVLGRDAEFAQRQKVEAVLPPWLAHPTIISTSIKKDVSKDSTITTEESNIENLSYLSPHIIESLKRMKITRLFPVQAAVVPWLIESHTKPPPFRPRDICVSAPTGSGKTLAFAIPVVQMLEKRVERKIRALAVLPVAELAQQIFTVFKELCEKTDLKVCLLSTQSAFAAEQEKLVECYKGTYHSKVDIVVTTPGRLVDHLHATKGFCLKSLKFLIIDEADRIMDEVFQNWLYHLDAHVHSTADQLLSGRSAPLCYNELQQISDTQPHKLLFSATLSQDPEKLQNLRLFQPKLFTSVVTGLEELREKYVAAAENEAEQQKATARGDFIGKFTTPVELTEKYCITENRLKPLTLYALITENHWQKFLCFTNSAEASSRLAFVLGQLMGSTLVIQELSALLSAKARAEILNNFSRGKINGLICSDALARGIDVPDVDIVVSYDPPRHIKTYIHRIGRTARAGRPGTAITLLSQLELDTFNGILTNVGKIITEEIKVSSDFEVNNAKAYSAALLKLRSKLEKEKRYKLLLKERLKQRPIAHTDADPTKLTLMQKLQLQAEQHLYQKDTEKDAAISDALRAKDKGKKTSFKNFMEKRKQATESEPKPAEVTTKRKKGKNHANNAKKSKKEIAS